MTPWDQRLARIVVGRLADAPMSANDLTALSLMVALCGAALIATAEPWLVDWGAGLFVAGRFLDHFDGEFARATGSTSRFGYYFDYVSGGASYAALFAALGIAMHGPLGVWAVALGLLAAAGALVSVGLNLGIDAAQADGSSVGYPAFGGFELEDGVYLLAPVTWLGWLPQFFVLAGVGAAVYTVWSMSQLRRARAAA
ncbi:MAG: CDP-alcohol phosphatidyltransferase family protein [Ectothiorhodospiraceae bacterium]|nr:CDP-alcohol phosphatidyltransferase family protein [Chromatiales bacterium]MCP5156991.1 CDP-alcohol phosphatidyltransferase family protein [Ectothiorhodospiraceae bacterium]